MLEVKWFKYDVHIAIPDPTVEYSNNPIAPDDDVSGRKFRVREHCSMGWDDSNQLGNMANSGVLPAEVHCPDQPLIEFVFRLIWANPTLFGTKDRILTSRTINGANKITFNRPDLGYEALKFRDDFVAPRVMHVVDGIAKDFPFSILHNNDSAVHAFININVIDLWD
ncbi:uncharacterized protein N7479_000094 [Penicillium vulpinum]|uniref:uncharacterized protein n=1 Tax=Penicillium vulpinum TaxID=29845 RepID=UPI00254890A6|nr:uncharacterized protein N7479_000094 [Penicillium vulpinum]KAJ5970176.1 hypothetical protein N7479_000094 [Penicillium vulpinum]